VFRVPAATSADCALSAIVPGQAGLVGLGVCFSARYLGVTRSRLWRLPDDGRWVGPVQPRLGSGKSVLLGLAAAGSAGSMWAAGFSGDAGIIALSGPLPPVRR
jgi:hypothetical protein